MAAVPNTDEYMQGCVCGDCPSYPGDDGFYCAKGASSNEVERKGCICGDCENSDEFGLTQDYYCGDGSAQEIDA